MAKKSLIETVIEVRVLSEEPFDYNDLENVHHAITEGDCSGTYSTKSSKAISGKLAADKVKEQGSDPEFFNMDEEGNELC